MACSTQIHLYRGPMLYGAEERLVNLSRLNPSVPYQSFGCYKVIELQEVYVECMRSIVFVTHAPRRLRALSIRY